MNTNTDPILLEWSAPSKVSHERSHRWYVIASVSTATMIAYGILSGAWSMSIVFALLGGLFFLIRNEDPVQHRIAIRRSGIEFDGKSTGWSEWKHFWILCAKDYCELHIESKKYLTPDIVIQTGSIDPYVLRDTLSEHVVQIDTNKEKILDAIIRFCKL